MSKIFITGGMGFIGSHVVEELTALGHTVTVYDNLHTGKKENLSNIPYLFIKGDVRDYNLLANVMQDQEIVFHLAALTSVAESMDNIEEYIAVNQGGTLNVLKAAKENEVKKVIFASSAAVYGETPDLPKTEKMSLNPKSTYAITKVDGECFCKLYNDSFGLPTVSARFFNVFGERQDPKSSYASAIPLFISKCIKNNPISVYGDGTQTRDFIYVKDLVRALILLMGKGVGVFNIGYGKALDINTLVRFIKSKLNSSSEIHYVTERPGEVKYSFSSIDKLRSIGFIPDFSLEKGLENTIEYYDRLNSKK